MCGPRPDQRRRDLTGIADHGERRGLLSRRERSLRPSREPVGLGECAAARLCAPSSLAWSTASVAVANASASRPTSAYATRRPRGHFAAAHGEGAFEQRRALIDHGCVVAVDMEHSRAAPGRAEVAVPGG